MNDFDLDDEEIGPKLLIQIIATSSQILETIAEVCSRNKSLSFKAQSQANFQQDETFADCPFFIAETRVIEGFTDIQSIRKIRVKRPLTPILAINDNLEPSFLMALYQAGATDFVASDISSEILERKITSLLRLSESARLAEIQNAQLIESMKAQRLANKKRILAEQEKAQAQLEAEANRQTKEIIDNLSKGFFVINKDLRILEKASSLCLSLFGKEIGGANLGTALNLKDEKELYIRASLEQVFDNLMPLNVSLSLLPKEVQTIDGKILDFSYTCLTDAKNDPLKVIIVASDITQDLLNKKRFEENERLNICIINILKNKESFLKFVADFKNEIISLKQTKDPVLGKRILHTLKGNSAAFGLEPLSKTIHEIETQVATTDAYLAQYLESATKIETLLKDFLGNNFDILKVDYDKESDERIFVDRKILTLLKKMKDRVDTNLAEEIQTFLNSLERDPFYNLMALYQNTVTRLGREYNKKIRFSFGSKGPHIDHKRFISLYKTLIHGISNACIHGIETPDERLSRGKNHYGNINVELSKVNDTSLFILIKDDGKGMDAEKIGELAIQRGLVKADHLRTMKKEEIFNFVFLDGFSTRDKVDESAGRGVGMSALKAEVDRLKGKIEITSDKNFGTEITISIPNELYSSVHEYPVQKEKFSILISEDEPDLLKLYCEYLKDDKFEIVTKNNGLDAILALSSKRFDLLITDLKMPGLTGNSLIRRIEEQMGDRAMMPIIVVTGFMSDELNEELECYSNVMIMQKPVNLDVLRREVNNALGLV